MKQIQLGIDGDQPFKIKSSGVSHLHARITIDDNNVWHLDDLNSSNGTYVRDEKGDLRRVGSVTITPMTFICLGPDNANGCSFYARQVLKPANYMPEFEYLCALENKFDVQEAQADSMAKNVRLLISAVSAVALIGSFLVQRGSEIQLLLLRVGSFVSLLSSALYDPNRKKKKILAARDKFHACPNPSCSHILSSREVHNMQCSRCKCQ